MFEQSQGYTSCFVSLAESNFVMAILLLLLRRYNQLPLPTPLVSYFSSHLTFLTFPRKHDVVRDFETYECLIDAFEPLLRFYHKNFLFSFCVILGYPWCVRLEFIHLVDIPAEFTFVHTREYERNSNIYGTATGSVVCNTLWLDTNKRKVHTHGAEK